MRKDWARLSNTTWRHEPSGAEVAAVAARGGDSGRMGLRMYEPSHGDTTWPRHFALRPAMVAAEELAGSGSHERRPMMAATEE